LLKQEKKGERTKFRFDEKNIKHAQTSKSSGFQQIGDKKIRESGARRNARRAMLLKHT
jgi:hypothetical protein